MKNSVRKEFDKWIKDLSPLDKWKANDEYLVQKAFEIGRDKIKKQILGLLDWHTVQDNKAKKLRKKIQRL